MKCPSCNAEGAYVGFSKVECPHAACRHYHMDAAIARIQSHIAEAMKKAVSRYMVPYIGAPISSPVVVGQRRRWNDGLRKGDFTILRDSNTFGLQLPKAVDIILDGDTGINPQWDVADIEQNSDVIP